MQWAMVGSSLTQCFADVVALTICEGVQDGLGWNFVKTGVEIHQYELEQRVPFHMGSIE